MLEVVFSDSVKASMRAAKNYDKKAWLGGAIGYVGRKPTKEELEKQFEGEAIGGDRNDVVCIGCNLDIGDIAGEFDGAERKDVFVWVYGFVRFEDSEIEQFFNAQREDFERLLSAAKNGKPIRAWKSNAPFCACAFAFLCDALLDIDCELSVVELPAYWETSENAMQSCNDWGELSPGQFYRFLPLERRVSAIEKHLQRDVWRTLMAENAPLRAMVNGRLISVPEDFYDHIILQNIPDGDFVMAQLIGAILGKHALGVGDGWYALRIKKMISENKLEVVGEKDASHPYGKILRGVKF